MLRQTKELVIACLGLLLAAGLLTGSIREGYILGLLVVACLLGIFVPGGWKPFVSLIGTLFGIALLGCFLYQLTALPTVLRNDTSLSMGLILLSLLAYLFRKFRRPKTDRSPRLQGAERTPIVPTGGTGE